MITSLGKCNLVKELLFECTSGGVSGKEFSSLRYVLDPEDSSGESEDNGQDVSGGLVVSV